METGNFREIHMESGSEVFFDNTPFSEDFESLDEIEFRRKLEDPFNLFQEGEYWGASELFCLNCGKKSHPFILKKVIVEEREKTEPKVVYVPVGAEFKPFPTKELKYKELKYCEVLRCGVPDCKELFFRTYTIKEGESKPDQEPCIIPARKDKIPIRNESGEKIFEKAYSRYVEAVVAYNMGMNYGAGASIRSVLEILCKIRGHYDAVLSEKINGRVLSAEAIDSLKRRIGLEELMDLLIPEFQKKSKRRSIKRLHSDIKAMMYWGHGVVHGSTDPTEKEIKSGLEILEEFFRVLYFDIIDTQKKESRRVKLSKNIAEFKGYRRR